MQIWNIARFQFHFKTKLTGQFSKLLHQNDCKTEANNHVTFILNIQGSFFLMYFFLTNFGLNLVKYCFTGKYSLKKVLCIYIQNKSNTIVRFVLTIILM